MIKFSLKCDQDHQFESWFKSAAAFDALAQAGHLTCALCGSTKVTKGMMAPRVTTGERREQHPCLAQLHSSSPSQFPTVQ